MFFYSRARKKWPTSSHFIEYTTDAPHINMSRIFR
ncbi:unnamed protein product [Schistosoma mattheei]|uniref:Uncharacterized protein n=1 Tax=Schistosoma mattheei TaxID=31246 RepID=A0A3P8HS39_9TREM|nr:unnamed protein product [Schistosoma mattheei]